MSEAIITRRSNLFALDNEGKKLPPWLFEQNDTFTVPITGKYRIICVGGGGNGSIQRSGNTMQGGGGGAGGIGILVIDLIKGNSYPITASGLYRSNSPSSFGNLITATAGTSTQVSLSGANYVTFLGVGGTASGDNVIIYKGGNPNSYYGGSVGLYIPEFMNYPTNLSDGYSIYTSGYGIFGNCLEEDFIDTSSNIPSNYSALNMYAKSNSRHMFAGGELYNYNDSDNTRKFLFIGGGGTYGGGGGCYSVTISNSTTSSGVGGAGGCVIVQFLGDVL